jgi:hypothetical protein
LRFGSAGMVPVARMAQIASSKVRGAKDTLARSVLSLFFFLFRVPCYFFGSKQAFSHPTFPSGMTFRPTKLTYHIDRLRSPTILIGP